MIPWLLLACGTGVDGGGDRAPDRTSAPTEPAPADSAPPGHTATPAHTATPPDTAHTGSSGTGHTGTPATTDTGSTADTGTGCPQQTTPPVCPGVDWAIHLHSSAIDSLDGLVVGPDGTLVAGGNFMRDMVFGEGQPGELTLEPFCGGRDQPWIARYQVDGTLVWARRVADSCADTFLWALDVAPDNSVVVGGRFSGDLTFGAGAPNEITISPIGGDSAGLYFARFAEDGTFLWAARTTDAVGWERIDDIAIGDSTVYIGGYFTGVLTFAPRLPEEITLASISQDMFVAAYALGDGTLRWARREGGTSGEKLLAAVAIGRGVAVSGHVGTDMVFDEGGPNETQVHPEHGLTVPLVRFGADGALDSAALLPGTDGLDAASVDADTFLLCGSTGGPGARFHTEGGEEVFIDAGQYFLTKVDANDNLLWAAGSADHLLGTGASCNAVAAWGTTAAVAGHLTGEELYHRCGPDPVPAWGPDEQDAFAVRYGLDGTPDCAWAVVGPNSTIAFGVAVDHQGGVIMGGYFREEAIVGLGTPQEQRFTADNESKDIFIVRYAQ